MSLPNSAPSGGTRSSVNRGTTYDKVQFYLNLHALLVSTGKFLCEHAHEIAQIDNGSSQINMDFLAQLNQDIMLAAGDFVIAAGKLVSVDRKVE